MESAPHNGSKHHEPHSSHDQQSADAPAQEPVALVDLHRALIIFHQAFDHPENVYIVSDMSVGAHMQAVPVGNGLDLWPSVVERARQISRDVGRDIRTIYVFAYSARARTFAENARRRIEQDQAVIVHADQTGVRVAAEPPSGGSSGSQAQEQIRAAWLSCTVRGQWRAEVNAARTLLAAFPHAILSADLMQRVRQALADNWVQVGCLTWSDTAAVHLWRQLSGTAASPVDTIAQALLACALLQRGDRAGAREALARAQAAVAGRSDLAPSAGSNDPDDAQHAVRHLIAIVEEFVDNDADQATITALTTAAMIRNGEQADVP